MVKYKSYHTLQTANEAPAEQNGETMNQGDLNTISATSSRKGRVHPKKKFDGYYLIAAFAIPFFVMLGVYACLGKHPFGNGSVLTLDLQAQYIYYYEALRRLLTEGGSFLYSWERTLGGEFMGIFAYYAASPFNWIFAIFPKSMILDAMMVIQLCKVGTMGLTFAYYLRKTRNTSDMLTVSFSTMYGLSAYAVIQLINPMWLDAMVFLPLLILGVESMIRQRRFILYTVSLFTILMSNYYTGYMCCIFTLIYYLYYYFLVRDELPQNPRAMQGSAFSRILHSRGFETFCRFAVFTVVAVLVSAFMLLCSWYSLGFGKTEFANSNFAFTLRFDFFDLFVKMLPGSYDTVRPSGLPVIYCGILTLVGLPLFFMAPAISRKKKILSAIVLGVLILSFSFNTIDLVWHGFSAPNWLNYRYSFLFTFFVLVLACDGIRSMRKVPFSKIAGIGVFLFVAVLVVQKLNYVFNQDTKTKPLDDMKCILLSLILILAYMAVLHFMKSDSMRSSGAFALAMIVCVEMFAASILNVTDVEMDVGSVRYDNYLSANGKTENYDGYNGSTKRIEAVVNEILEKDKSFYRMESMVYRKEGGVNEPMTFGYKGISHSTSALNTAVINLMGKLGYASRDHWTKYLGGTPVSDALLGIKYVVTKNDTLDKNLYTVAASGDEYYKYVPSKNTIYAMQNTKALSVAYGVSPYMIEKTEGFLNPPYYSSLDLQNRLVNAMLYGVMDTPNVVRGIYAKPSSYVAYNHDHAYRDKNGEMQYATNSYYHATGGTFSFELVAEEDGDIYAHFPGVLFQGMSTKCGLYVNGRRVSDYYTNESWRIQKLGTFKKGDMLDVEIRFDGTDLYISRASKYFFYYIDYAALNTAFAELEASSMYVEKYGNDYLEGTIDLPEGQELIFTSIPYDEGWQVYIDGEKAETVKALDSLLAVPSTAGFHEIKFVYRSYPVVYGTILTVIGILLFAFFVVWSLSRKARTLAGCKDEKSTHFFHYAGDAENGWHMELQEEEDSLAGENPDEKKPALPESCGEGCADSHEEVCEETQQEASEALDASVESPADEITETSETEN